MTDERKPLPWEKDAPAIFPDIFPEPEPKPLPPQKPK